MAEQVDTGRRHPWQSGILKDRPGYSVATHWHLMLIMHEALASVPSTRDD